MSWRRPAAEPARSGDRPAAEPVRSGDARRPSACAPSASDSPQFVRVRSAPAPRRRSSPPGSKTRSRARPQRYVAVLARPAGQNCLGPPDREVRPGLDPPAALAPPGWRARAARPGAPEPPRPQHPSRPGRRIPGSHAGPSATANDRVSRCRDVSGLWRTPAVDAAGHHLRERLDDRVGIGKPSRVTRRRHLQHAFIAPHQAGRQPLLVGAAGRLARGHARCGSRARCRRRTGP